jgi:hypothetical protein
MAPTSLALFSVEFRVAYRPRGGSGLATVMPGTSLMVSA